MSDPVGSFSQDGERWHGEERGWQGHRVGPPCPAGTPQAHQAVQGNFQGVLEWLALFNKKFLIKFFNINLL